MLLNSKKIRSSLLNNVWTIAGRTSFAASALMAATGVHAQSFSVLDKQPPVIVPDENGVDLKSGSLGNIGFATSIGAPGDPAFNVISGRAGSAAPTGSIFAGHIVMTRCTQASSMYCSTWRRVEFTGFSRWFNGAGNDGEGDLFTQEGGLDVVTLRDGTRLRFDPSKVPTQPQNSSEYETSMLVDITKPDGEVITFSNFNYGSPSYWSSNRGYAALQQNANSGTVTMRLINTSKSYCSANGQCGALSGQMPALTQTFTNTKSSGSTNLNWTATDPSGRSTSHLYKYRSD